MELVFQYPLVDWGDGDTAPNFLKEYPDYEFQYPLVDWGDGDVFRNQNYCHCVIFQYPLVDWGDGDQYLNKGSKVLVEISVSSGGLG